MRYILIILFALGIMSCKKDYTCACTNSNGTYNAGDITTTKSSAKKYCEGLSTQSTKCTIK